MNLREVRKQWEQNLVLKTAIDHFVSKGHVLVILQNKRTKRTNNFYCHRYFPIGSNDNWTCSVDARESSFETVLALPVDIVAISLGF